MKIPGIVWTTLAVVVIGALNALAGELPGFDEPWVPFAAIAIGAIVKMLQLWINDRKLGEIEIMAQPSKVRRFFLG